jgi:hypothetical protein
MQKDQVRETIGYVMEFSDGKDLKIPNDYGDYPLHVVAKAGLAGLTELIAKKCPEMVFRENANGRTPYEVIDDIRLSKLLLGEPLGYTKHLSIEKGKPQNTRPSNNAMQIRREIETANFDKTCDILKAVSTEFEASKKRKLVSLFEANTLTER